MKKYHKNLIQKRRKKHLQKKNTSFKKQVYLNKIRKENR